MAQSNSKSDLIRGYLKRNKGATIKEIIDGIKNEDGVTVSTALASKIKYDRANPKKAPSRNGRSQPRRTAVTAARTTTVGLNIEALIATKRAADEVGGLDALRSSLEVLEALGAANVV